MNENMNDKKLSELLKAVSDSTRRSILTHLCQQGPGLVTDLSKHYDMSLNAVSKHIKVLEKSGLVVRKRLGRYHWIMANLEQINIIEQWVNKLNHIWLLRLEKLDKILSEP